jgi:hypothetical protein
MLRAMWRALETESRDVLTGHEGGNAGYSQGLSYGSPRQRSTLPGRLERCADHGRVGASYRLRRRRQRPRMEESIRGDSTARVRCRDSRKWACTDEGGRSRVCREVQHGDRSRNGTGSHRGTQVAIADAAQDRRHRLGAAQFIDRRLVRRTRRTLNDRAATGDSKSKTTVL